MSGCPFQSQRQRHPLQTLILTQGGGAGEGAPHFQGQPKHLHPAPVVADVKTDLRNAGANWVDDEVVECSRGPNTLVSSRKPDDLPAFCNTLVGVFAKDASHSRNPAREC